MTTTLPDPDSMTLLRRLRFYLLEPWWRALWFVGAIVWGVVFNVLFVVVEPREELFGIVSVIPIFAFIIEQQSRARKVRMDKARLERM